MGDGAPFGTSPLQPPQVRSAIGGWNDGRMERWAHGTMGAWNDGRMQNADFQGSRRLR
ncbi:hypothetical protein K227x_23040 [Rubripirellula lacrimiformis]|uniref:Uncharacterized protein n=1 Tax=Rubripirellula lacrimiformis TaxID=1930273 RepID=A0A517N9V7_9BACT|nr:hypothetical protein K227x_23040 [Rubripirellula lacrimiformis]